MQQQQPPMQMQPMMAAYASQNQVTTDIIQQYLDENKQLILAILDNQNSGKTEECAQNQAKLQRNLMYLAAIADNQSQGPAGAQYSPSAVMQSSMRYMQNQQAQQAQPITPQSIFASRSSMALSQTPPLSALHLQRQQQAALHSQLGVSPGTSSGFNIMQGETSLGGNGPLATGVFPDFTRASGSGREEGGHALPTDGRGGGSSGGQSGDGTQMLYLKPSEEEGN